MWKFSFLKRQLSIKGVGLVSAGNRYVLLGGVPLCGQVEGVLDGVALGWSHEVLMASGVGSALWLLLPLLLFTAGVVGVGLTQSNFLRLLVALELLLLGVNLNFILFSAFFTAVWGQVFALLIVAVGAAEAAIGLAILIALYRVRGTLALQYFNLLRG